MDSKYSLTYKGVILTVLGLVFGWAGVPFIPEKADGTISFITELIGVITTLIGRYRAGGVNPLGFRK